VPPTEKLEGSNIVNIASLRIGGSGVSRRHGAMQASGLAVALLVLTQAGPAAAALYADADASAGSYAGGDTYQGNESIVHARALAYQADDGDGNGTGSAGPGEICPGADDLSCAVVFSGGPAIGTAAAEVRGDSGAMKVRAHAIAHDAEASSVAMLSDSLSFRSSDRRLRFDIDIAEVTGIEGGYGEFSFLLMEGRFEEPLQGDEQRNVLAAFTAYNDNTTVGGYYEVRRFVPGGGLSTNIEDLELIDSGYDIPLHYAFEFDIDTICPSFNGMNVCADPGGNVTFEFTARLEAEASVFGDGLAGVEADRTVHLQVLGPYVSANGYTYASPVPLPAAGWLFGASMLILGPCSRRRG